MTTEVLKNEGMPWDAGVVAVQRNTWSFQDWFYALSEDQQKVALEMAMPILDSYPTTLRKVLYFLRSALYGSDLPDINAAALEWESLTDEQLALPLPYLELLKQTELRPYARELQTDLFSELVPRLLERVRYQRSLQDERRLMAEHVKSAELQAQQSQRLYQEAIDRLQVAEEEIERLTEQLAHLTGEKLAPIPLVQVALEPVEFKNSAFANS